jgi:hypothetical protein
MAVCQERISKNRILAIDLSCCTPRGAACFRDRVAAISPMAFPSAESGSRTSIDSFAAQGLDLPSKKEDQKKRRRGTIAHAVTDRFYKT